MSGMDGDELRRSFYQRTTHPQVYEASPHGRESHVPTLPSDQPRSRFGSSGDPERYGQPQSMLRQSPGVAQPAGSPSGLSSFDYAQGQQYQAAQMPPHSLQYHPEYSQVTQPYQRQEAVSNYEYRMDYNVAHHPQSDSPFGVAPQYHPRQSTAVEVLSNQFGEPRDFTGVEGTSSFGPPISSQPVVPRSFQQAMQFNPSSNLERSSSSSPYNSMGTNVPQDAAAEPQGQHQRELDNLRQKYLTYDLALRRTNDSTSRGKLVEALASLRDLTNILLTNVETLGLTKDNESLYLGRLELWENFNLCWLGFLVRQEENTKQKHASLLPADEDVLPMASLELLGDELTRLLDPLETHGLIDYSMGVAEEEIITMLLNCQRLLQAEEESNESASEAHLADIGAASSSRQGPGN